jgi:hypothetical protein
MAAALIASLGPAAVAATSGTKPAWNTNDHWAGYYAVQRTPADPVPVGVQGIFHVPKVTCADKKLSRVAVWAGLGQGTDADPLYQLGIGASCVDGVPQYDAWTEFYKNTNPEPAHFLKGKDPWGRIIQVIPGDILSVTVSPSDPSGSSSAPLTWGIVEESADGTKLKWGMNGSFTRRSVPKSAECITERPFNLNTRSFFRLPKFTPIVWGFYPTDPEFSWACKVRTKDSYVYEIASTYLLPWGGGPLTMLNKAGATLVTTTPRSNNGTFTNKWQAAS